MSSYNLTLIDSSHIHVRASTCLINGVPSNALHTNHQANEGDIIHVQVTNKNPFMGTSIHWHGMHQRGTPYMDGVAAVTQCQLQPLGSQNFTFEAYPPGTHFWHGHFGMDIADGMAGPIIIHPKSPEPFEYDEDVVIFLQDFWLTTGEQQQVGLLSKPSLWVGEPQSILMGGKGLASKCYATSEETIGCIEGCGEDLFEQLMVVRVVKGKVYRLRFIQASSVEAYNIAVKSHNLTIVEVEGTNIIPVDCDSFNIGAGQRFSALLTADQEPGSYWLDASIAERDYPTLFGRVIIQYVEAEDEVPGALPLHPIWNATGGGYNSDEWIGAKTLDPSSYPEYSALTASQNEIKRYVLVTTQNHDADGGLVWGINNISFHFSSTEPLIGSAVRAAREAGWPTEIPNTIDIPPTPPNVWNYSETDQSYPALGSKGASIIPVNKGEVIEIILQNTYDLGNVSDIHQWHMHGHSFWVVGQGSGVWSEEDVSSYNLVNPLLRDTINQWPLGWSAIRLPMTNPGAWFFHCHIAPHLMTGMASVIVVQPDLIERNTENVQVCSGSDSMGYVELAETSGSARQSRLSMAVIYALVPSLLFVCM